MKKIILVLLKILSKFIKKDKRLITILFRGYSGSNLSPIIEQLSLKEFEDYNVKILRADKYTLSSINRGGIISAIKERYIKYKYVFKSQLVLSTHGFYRLRDDNIMMNLWHGIPLKAMSLMNKSKSDEVGVINDDYLLSTSDFYNTAMNACLGIRAEQYYITGYPRNDYLFKEHGRENLENLLARQIKGKVILYMPTYKDIPQNYQDGKVDNFFGFREFDFEKFNEYLEENNLYFILKLHPNDERIFRERYLKFNKNNMILLKGEELENKKMDLYKIINAIDLLITDYSSIYFDYLLLNRPVIFTPSDIQEYRENRGFLLEPYDFWTPGPKCFDQETLQMEIIKSINDILYYKNERETIRNIVHKYQDGDSTKRVIRLIHELMEC